MEQPKNICVIVLGDIGRSPRMQYHSISLAERGHKVDVICYQETRPNDALTLQPAVNFHYLVPYPSNIPCPKLLNLIFKTLWQAITLFFVLFIIRKPGVLLIQNPPAVPALFICWVYSVIANAKFIIDWHNYAHTIMALNVGSLSLLVKLTKNLEVFAGQKATHNFCVTNEMKNDLLDRWNIRATTLYDRPPELFRPVSLSQKHDIINCLAMKYSEFKSNEGDGTIFTSVNDDTISLRTGRPGFIISSTSWTEDEDFSILLKALQDFETHHKSGNHLKLPQLICVITGIGPLKQYYCDQIKQKKWQHVKVITPWLEAKDYPLLLAAADLGVSLHFSSSGLDLPMKVVDMFGCGLPVCAYNFKCLHELVKHNENGFVFNTSEELSDLLRKWFANFPNNKEQMEDYKRFKTELDMFQKLRWKENWLKIAAEAFE